MLIVKGGQNMPQSEVIPSPSFGINYVLGGGFWTGRFSILWGNYSSGKTTFLLHTLAKAQEMGYTPVIIDAENSYTDEWGEKCGLDLGQRIWMKSNIAESILHEVQAMMKSNIKYAILIDSINAIQSSAFFDEKGGIASGARSRNKLLTTLSEHTHPEKNIVFAVAQQTLDLSGTYPKTVGKLGNAEDHIATNIIRLFGSKAKDKVKRASNDMIINKQIEWTVQKCKQAPVEGTEGHYWFNPQNADIDTSLEILDIAVYNGIIEQSGAWFKFHGEKFHGMENLRDAVVGNQNLMDNIICDIKTSDLKFVGEDNDD